MLGNNSNCNKLIAFGHIARVAFYAWTIRINIIAFNCKNFCDFRNFSYIYFCEECSIYNWKYSCWWQTRIKTTSVFIFTNLSFTIVSYKSKTLSYPLHVILRKPSITNTNFWSKTDIWSGHHRPDLYATPKLGEDTGKADRHTSPIRRF